MSEGEQRSGRIDEVHGMLVTLITGDGERLRCRPPRDRQTPVVGDRCEAIQEPGGDWRLTRIHPRERTFSRCHEHGLKPMATHLDRLIIASAVEPCPRPGLIDRMVITSDPEVEIWLVLNKSDLTEALPEAVASLADHVAVGARLFPLSCHTGEGVDALRQALTEGTSIFVGHSGVGKSSLLNALLPEAHLTTGDVNALTHKGRHTTTVATMHPLGPEGWLIDTPGVRAWSLDGLPLSQIAARFPGLQAHARACHFSGCLHDGEPDCAVIEAAEAGEIPAERVARYLELKASVLEERANRRKASHHDQRNRRR